ncbi:MAG: HEPN domain-containing protein [Bacteroidales bacterium]
MNTNKNKVINIEVIAKAWENMSDSDYGTMLDLYNAKRYSWSLFVGHLVIEKLLKACYVRNSETHPPLIHDLLKLALKSEINLNEKQKLILDTITTFNINARYDDYKQTFYKKCTQVFTKKWINNITELRQWIKEKQLK